MAIATHGGTREDWLDLSTGINPNAYPIPEMSDYVWQSLPDQTAQDKLISGASFYYKVQADYSVVAANGTQAIIQLLPQVLNQKSVAIVSPTYEEHFHCWEKAQRKVTRVATLEEAVEIAEIVVVVNPNNPTAVTHQPDQLVEAAKKLEQVQGFLIVDEAFCDVVPALSVVPQQMKNMIVLRSFGKFFGLAGLRLGFAICHKSFADGILSRQGPWSVSGPALEVGSTAFCDVDWIESTRSTIKQHSEAQTEVVAACGLRLIGNAGLFMEFDHEDASIIHEALLGAHILTRAFPQRPTRLRFGLCKNMDDLERFAWVLKTHA
jgi:cobalamin biosynthetic protein CobC